MAVNGDHGVLLLDAGENIHLTGSTLEALGDWGSLILHAGKDIALYTDTLSARKDMTENRDNYIRTYWKTEMGNTLNERLIDMQFNLEELLQEILYAAGVMYFAKDVFLKYRGQKFKFKRNRNCFIIGALGGILGLLLFAYLFFISPKDWESVFPLFECMCFMLAVSEYLYFTSLVNEAKYKHIINEKNLSDEYVSYNRKRYFCVCFMAIMFILLLIYFLIFS